MSGEKLPACPRCGGCGTIRETRNVPGIGAISFEGPCPDCLGEGVDVAARATNPPAFSERHIKAVEHMRKAIAAYSAGDTAECLRQGELAEKARRGEKTS